MINVLGIVQARCSSSRLPGKVLKPILGQAMILRQLERLGRVNGIDRLVLATSDDPSDDELARVVEGAGVPVFRGELDNVLARFHHAALRFGPCRHVARMTGDCPVTDAGVIDEVIRVHLAHDNDYTTNAQVPSYPHGMDVEVMTWAGLEESFANAELPSEKEHVTLYLKNHPEKFRLENIRHEPDWSHYRVTVDEPEDFEVVSRIYEALYERNPAFDMLDIVRLLDAHPALREINSGMDRHAGLNKSLAQDAAYLDGRE